MSRGSERTVILASVSCLFHFPSLPFSLPRSQSFTFSRSLSVPAFSHIPPKFSSSCFFLSSFFLILSRVGFFFSFLLLPSLFLSFSTLFLRFVLCVPVTPTPSVLDSLPCGTCFSAVNLSVSPLWPTVAIYVPFAVTCALMENDAITSSTQGMEGICQAV